MELHLKITGGILIAIAIMHIALPGYFNWKKELASLSLINNQLMYVHTFFIAFIIFLMGVFCIYASTDIVHTALGQQLAFGLFIFWLTRLLFQFFVYSPRLWKGKTFETTIHIVLSCLWIYFTIVFFIIYWG